jgi:predicted ribosomally synthesized peptide with SipW-like signal peptide
MKKIIGLAIAAIAVVVLASGGTFAYFSDTQKSSGDSIQAGTVTLSTTATSYFTSTFSTKAYPTNGTIGHEVITLTPGGGTNAVTGCYLSIKLANVNNVITGFPTPAPHDLTGAAVTAGDLGLGTTLAIWLSPTTTGATPAANDIQLIIPAAAAHAGTPTSLGSGPSALTYSDWAHTMGKTTSYNNGDSAYWNNATLGAAIDNSHPWYLHVSWKLPESGTAADNQYQGLKLTSDWYFTLSTVNNPYSG